MNHPLIERIERTGYPFIGRRQEYGVDPLGQEVFEGDEILVYEDEFFLVETLTSESREILEIVGAVYQIAK